MICPVSTQTFSLPDVDRREILRYAGVRSETPELSALLDAVLSEAGISSGSVCWTAFPVRREGELLHLGFAETSSASLKRTLSGCDRIVLFAATVGLGVDRLIHRYGAVSPAKALMLQAVGTERIEALCDQFCDMIRLQAQTEGMTVTSRFSPGYGDFPLELQREIFQVLDCPRKIGLTLNESLLMSPSKSVTAIIGLGRCVHRDSHSGCSQCSKADCLYRRMP